MGLDVGRRHLLSFRRLNFKETILIALKYHPGDKGRPARKDDNPTAICEPIV
jgi:hypothetical protein